MSTYPSLGSFLQMLGVICMVVLVTLALCIDERRDAVAKKQVDRLLACSALLFVVVVGYGIVSMFF